MDSGPDTLDSDIAFGRILKTQIVGLGTILLICYIFDALEYAEWFVNC